MDLLADQMATSPEYIAATSNKSLEEIISCFYPNLFNRYLQPAGLALWVEQVANSNTKTQDVGLFISRAALEAFVADGEVNTDQQVLMSKVDAANLFTEELALA